MSFPARGVELFPPPRSIRFTRPDGARLPRLCGEADLLQKLPLNSIASAERDADLLGDLRA